MRIVILDDYADSVRSLKAFEQLHGHDVVIYRDPVASLDQWAQRLAGAQALIPIRERTAINQAILDRAPALRIVSSAGSLPGNLDVDACSARGIAVAQSRGSGHATAELCWALILAAQRRLPEQIASLRDGRWQGPLGRQLFGRQLGLWGFGRVAQQVAHYGKAFGMHVVVWGRDSTLEKARAAGYDTAVSRAALLAQSDVLSLHLKLTAQTEGLLTERDFAQMKPGAVFVNTARAGLVARGALEAALSKGSPSLAAIDVFDDEPLFSRTDPLLAQASVIATPHIGFVEADNFEAFFGGAFDNILRYEAGDTSHLVNRTALAS